MQGAASGVTAFAPPPLRRTLCPTLAAGKVLTLHAHGGGAAHVRGMLRRGSREDDCLGSLHGEAERGGVADLEQNRGVGVSDRGRGEMEHLRGKECGITGTACTFGVLGPR